MNGKVEVTCQKFQTIAHSIMVHTRVSDKYIHFTLVYTNHYICPVLPIKHLINHGKVEVTCQKFQTIAHSIMVHTRVLDEYIHF